MGGNAHGINRRYQLECRDVIMYRHPGLTPWSSDGIDVAFDLADTRWTFDVALRGPSGDLLLAECRRTRGAVKQEALAAFAYKVEMARKTLCIPVAGVFFAKREHQVGAVKVGEFHGIQIAILEQGSVPPGFNLTFLRYDKQRAAKCYELIKHIPPGSVALKTYAPKVLIRSASRKHKGE